MANLHVTDPLKIRELTAEIADLKLPLAFVPNQATSLLGTTMVSYRWCPTGTCNEDETSELTLISIPDFGDKNSAFPLDSGSDEELKSRFKHFTKTVHEIEIRGKKYPFTFVLGDERPPSEPEDDDSEIKPMDEKPAEPSVTAPEAGEPKTTDPAMPDAATAALPASPAAEGKKSWWIFGAFPGKKGQCMLTLQLTPDQYNETIILEMLQSIQ